MDAADLWASRFAAAKRQYSLHHNSHPGGDRRSLMDDLEAEEELRPDFPCPYCYEDYDIASLCSHLEDEHPSVESRAAVCPICLVKVPRDLLNHIMLQHRRQRLRKVALSSSQASSLLGYDLREANLSVLLGGGGGRGGYRLSGINSSGTSVLVNDSLLSTLVLNFTSPEPEEASKAFASSVDDFLKKSTPSSQSWKSRCYDAWVGYVTWNRKDDMMSFGVETRQYSDPWLSFLKIVWIHEMGSVSLKLPVRS